MGDPSDNASQPPRSSELGEPDETAEMAGRVLRSMRQLHRTTQARLAAGARISTRHLSFLETGRALPTRSVLERIADTLKLSIGDRALLMESAGFFERTPLDDGMGPPMEELKRLVDAQAVPALVNDYDGTLIVANELVHRIITACLPEALPLAPSTSVFHLFMRLRPFITSWEAVSAVVQRRTFEEAHRTAARPLLEALHMWGSGPAPDPVKSARPRVFAPLELKLPNVELSFGMAVMTLGTPGERRLRRYRFLLGVPMDGATRSYCKDPAPQG